MCKPFAVFTLNGAIGRDAGNELYNGRGCTVIAYVIGPPFLFSSVGDLTVAAFDALLSGLQLTDFDSSFIPF